MELTLGGAIATFCFASALIQSLLSAKTLALSDAYKERSPRLSRLLHFAGEPEIVFGMWAAVFVFIVMFMEGFYGAMEFLDARNFDEVAFVFVIMILASSKPITDLAEFLIGIIGRFLPLPLHLSGYVAILVVGPLLGSLITEPAAMTVTAMLLRAGVLSKLRNPPSNLLFYSTLGVLFVNVSVGGSLTHFAAPPVLMVARVWEWDTPFMFATYGWKALIAVVLNVAVACAINFKELKTMSLGAPMTDEPVRRAPAWVTIVHVVFVTLCVMAVHHPTFVLGLFILYLGFFYITKEDQEPVRIEQSMLVGFFLGGLVILTSTQGWWLKPILTNAQDLLLYVGTLTLAPVTDNAAITSLAAQVPDLSERSKYLVVAGALIGGGMTIIANAPNPAGFAILRDKAPGQRLRPELLFVFGGIPTVITATLFWFL